MRFSPQERNELLKSWFIVSLAFAVARGGIFRPEFITTLVSVGVTAGIGFILHELAHKYFAQKYGAQAEFHSFDQLLIIGLLLSFFGFLLLAPGAVVIKGIISKRQYGMTSLAGPSMNYLLAIVFFALFFTTKVNLFAYGAFINTWLGLFNLLPFFGLDGEKVLNWNKQIYIPAIAIGIGLLYITSFL
jgi:Zn-dependent protease